MGPFFTLENEEGNCALFKICFYFDSSMKCYDLSLTVYYVICCDMDVLTQEMCLSRTLCTALIVDAIQYCTTHICICILVKSYRIVLLYNLFSTLKKIEI